MDKKTHTVGSKETGDNDVSEKFPSDVVNSTTSPFCQLRVLLSQPCAYAHLIKLCSKPKATFFFHLLTQLGNNYRP